METKPNIFLIRFKSIGTGSPYPFNHPDWTVIPANGRGIPSIETDAVIEACARAFTEQGGNVSC
jgi:hypothetical protein